MKIATEIQKLVDGGGGGPFIATSFPGGLKMSYIEQKK